MKYCDQCHSTFPSEFNTCPRDQNRLRSITELSPGVELRGKYRIEEKVGEGGMATVYRASHLHFKEELAIKVVSGSLSGNQEFLDRFKREAVITRRLRHPNAVRLDDFDFTEDGRPFIAMEYVRGKTLRQVLQETGVLPVARAFNIGRQTAWALYAAHTLGIVHRDIKPDNIVLVTQPDGTDLVKVLDFGIAKATGEALDASSGVKPTSTGMVLGTPHYLSPEQARGKKSIEIDGRSDLYALGVMLYEMLTGELPFKSETALEMLLHHIQTAPTPPHLHKPELQIPEAASLLVMKAMEKDPSLRFQTGEEMAEELAHFINAAPAAASGVAASATTELKTPGGSRVASFGTAALAAAAETRVLGSQAMTVQAKTPVAQPEAETRVLGSQGVTVQARTPSPEQFGFSKPTPSAKKSRKVLWIAGAIAALLIAAWLGRLSLGSQPSQARPATNPDYNRPETQTQPVHHPPRRAQQQQSEPVQAQLPHNRYPQQTQSNPSNTGVNNPANDPKAAMAQQMVAQANNRMTQRDFNGAAALYQSALELDPNNTAAQKGLRAAQAGEALRTILHR